MSTAGAGSSDAKQNATHSTGASAGAFVAFTTLKALEDDLKAKEVELKELNNKLDGLAKQQVEAIDADKKEKAQALEKQIARVEKDKERVQKKIDALEADVRAARSPGAGAAAGSGDAKAAAGAGNSASVSGIGRDELRQLMEETAKKAAEQAAQAVASTLPSTAMSTAVKQMAFKTFDDFKRSEPKPLQLPYNLPARVTEQDMKKWCAIWAKPPKCDDDENTKYHPYFQLAWAKCAALLKADDELKLAASTRSLPNAKDDDLDVSLRPDFVRSALGVEKQYMSALIELKVRPKSSPRTAFAPTDADQVLQYAQSVLLRAQRWRTRVTVALCDCECIQLFELTREVGEPQPPLQLRVYPIASLTAPDGANALAHLLTADAKELGYDRPALRLGEIEPVICQWLGRGSTGEVFAVTDPDGDALALCERWRSAPAASRAPAAAMAVDVKAEGAAAAEAKAAPVSAAGAGAGAGAGLLAEKAAADAVTTSGSGVVGVAVRRHSVRVLARAARCAERVIRSPDRPKRKRRPATDAAAAACPVAAGAAAAAAGAGELALAGAAEGLRPWHGVAKWYRRLAGGSDLKRAFGREVDAYRVLNAAHCPGVLFCVASQYPYVLLDGVGDRVTKLVIDDVEPLLHTLQTMHSCGVLHLDIRFSNLLRCGNRITVIDFTCSVPTNTASDGSGTPTGASDAQYSARIHRKDFGPTPADDLIALVREVWLQNRQKSGQRRALGAMTDAQRLSWWQQQTSASLKRLMSPAAACNYAALANELRDFLTAE